MGRYQAQGCIVVHSLAAALAAAGLAAGIMVIGGASLYAQTLARAERIYLTLVAAEPEGDVRFPELERGAWREVWREDHPADARHDYPFSFILLER